MAMAFPNDADAAALLPECPKDGVEQIHQKQYGHFRKELTKFIREVRSMLHQLPEKDAAAVLKPLQTSLLLFLAAKQGKMRHTPIKPAKGGKVTAKEEETGLVGARPEDSTTTPIGPTGPFAPPDPGNPATPTGPYPPPPPKTPDIPPAGP